MNIYKKRVQLIVLFIIAINSPSNLAQELNIADKQCPLPEFSTKPALTKLYELSRAFALNTCKAMLADDVRAVKDSTFLTGGLTEEVRQEALSFYSTSFPETSFPSVKEAKYLWAAYQYPETLQMNTYELTLAYPLGRQLRFSGPNTVNLPTFTSTDETEAQCLSLGYSSCKNFFSEIERVGRIQNHFIRKNGSDKALAGIRKKSRAWDKFSDNSRFQTPVDIFITSWLYSEKLSDGRNLNLPPSSQYFVLHPSVVIDHFSAAQAGDKTELSLALEWAGFNRWDAKIPWGVSIASVYSDRVSGDSVGHGLMFHVYNNFSFGFANRGSGDNSFYINIEFMDWFGEKQGKYKSYKKNVGL